MQKSLFNQQKDKPVNKNASFSAYENKNEAKNIKNIIAEVLATAAQKETSNDEVFKLSVPEKEETVSRRTS
jgi:hypothetical protein